MELKKRPKTEVEYWETISSLQSFIAATLQLLQKAVVPRRLEHEAEDARQILEHLIREAEEKFSVFVPMPSALSEIDKTPEGMINFWEWAEKMERRSFSSDFRKMVCFDCPYTLGLEHLIKTGGCVVACHPRALQKPSECILVSGGMLTDKEFKKKIKAEFGEGILMVFLNHQKSIARA